MSNNFDWNKVWQGVKAAYIVQSVVVIVFAIVIFAQVLPRVTPPSKETSKPESERFKAIYQDGQASGIEQGFKDGIKATKKEIAFRMLLAGIDQRHTESLVDADMGENYQSTFDRPNIGIIQSELESMSDQQIIELKRMNITELNRLRNIAKQYNPSQEDEKEHRLYKEGTKEGSKEMQEKLALNMLLAGMEDYQIMAITKIDKRILNELKSLSDQQLIEIKGKSITEINSLRELLKKESSFVPNRVIK